jgi:hypothetical protein
MGKEYNERKCFLFMHHPFCMVGWWVLVYLGHNNYGVHNLKKIWTQMDKSIAEREKVQGETGEQRCSQSFTVHRI